MATKVLKISADGGFADAVREAVDTLDAGRLVAFPTETVYGVGVRADRSDALARLREVKSRDQHKAFTVHVGEPSDAERYVPRISGVGRRYMAKAWPGPLTLIFPVAEPDAAAERAGIDREAAREIYIDNTIGLRCPDEPVATALLSAVSGPVVASSANLAGHAPPWTAQDVLRDLDGAIDLLIDAGQTRYAKPSTIVRLRENGYEMVREGVYDAGIMARLAQLRILFVCTGNTCRSVMAEALAKQLLSERLGCSVEDLPEHGVFIASAGVSGGVGGATDHAVAVMKKRGLDVAGHASAALSLEMIRQSDYVFAMTDAHRRRVCELDPSATGRCFTLIENRDVQDPIGAGIEDYERCAQEIEQGLRHRLERIDI